MIESQNLVQVKKRTLIKLVLQTPIAADRMQLSISPNNVSILEKYLSLKKDITERRENNWGSQLGFWSALVSTLLGVVYFGVILGTIITGNFTFPPPEPIQIIAGIISLLFCPIFLVVMASLHAKTPPNKKTFSQIGLALTILFAISVSINRFIQLGIVRQNIAIGGVDWFLPYGSHSVMFGLEIMGWGWFLGLAMIFVAPLFSRGRLELWLRWLSVSYGVLGLVSALGQLLASPIIMVGFIAWGIILFIITALLAVYFRRGENAYS